MTRLEERHRLLFRLLHGREPNAAERKLNEALLDRAGREWQLRAMERELHRRREA